MATNQEIFELLLQMNPGNSVADTRALAARLARELKDGLNSGEVIDANKISATMQEALKKGASGSKFFSDLPQQLQDSLTQALHASSGTFGQFFREMAAVYSREMELATARATERASRNLSTGTDYILGSDYGRTGEEANKKYGLVRAFDPSKIDDSAQITQAQLKAKDNLIKASSALNTAYGNLYQAISGAAAAEVAGERKQDEARARIILAMNKRAEDERQQAVKDLAASIKRGPVNGQYPLSLDPNFLRLQQIRAADTTTAAGLRSLLGPAVKNPLLGLNPAITAYQQERDAAAVQAQREAALEEFRQRQTLPYANPNTATPLGRAQEQANKATENLATQQKKLADEMAKAVPDVERLVSASRALRTAEEQLAVANKRAAALSEAPPSGLLTQFGLGFRGKSGDPYAVQLGQAAKFSLLYGTAYKALFAFTQTMQQTLQEGIQFEQSVSELKLATGQSADAAKELANQLGQQAANAGFSPSEGALAGARAIGLYGASDATKATQDAIARISTDVATKIAFNSGMQIQDVQTNLAAITNAFQLGYAGQGQIADLDAYFSHKFGVAPGQTIQSVAEAGSVGQQAGFSLNQTTAIAALLQGRTGQSADAVAGYMAQIFSRGGEGALANLGQKYGINQNETLAQQIAQLSRIYKSSSLNDQNQIAAAFGRGKVQNAVSVLLGSFDDVSKAANEASKGLANGASDKAFGERINNLGGQLQLLLSSFKDFANQLGQSGVLGVLGLAVEALKQLMDSATNLLRVWNQIPGITKTVLASLALFALATRTAAGQALIGGLVSRGGGIVGTVAGRGQFITQTGEIAAFGSRAGLGAAGSGALAALGTALPWVGALAGLYAIGEVTGAVHKFNDALKAQVDAMSASTSDLTTPDQFLARADALRQQAAQDGVHGLWGNLGNILSGGTMSANERRIDAETKAEADRLRAYAGALAADQPSANARSLLPLDPQGLSDGLTKMAAAGASAQQQIAALRDSILGAGGAADRAKRSFNPVEFAGRIAAGLPVNLDDPNLAVTSKGKYFGFNMDYSRANVQNQLPGDFKDLGIKSENLSPKQVSALVDRLMQDNTNLPGGIGDLTIENSAKTLRQHLLDVFTAAVSNSIKDVKAAIKTLRSPEQIGLAFENLDKLYSTELANLPQTDLAGRAQVLQEKVKLMAQALRNLAKNGKVIPPGLLQQLQGAQNDLAEAQIAALDNERKVAQQGVRDQSKWAAIGRGYLVKMTEVAARLNDQDQLAALIARTGKAGVAVIKGALQKMINAAKTAVQVAIEAQRAEVQLVRQAQQALAGIANDGGLGELQSGPLVTQNPQETKHLQQLKDHLHHLQDLANSVDGIVNDGTKGLGDFSGTDVPGYKTPTAGPSKADLVARGLAIRASLRQLAIDMTNPVAEARVAVADALDRVKHALNREDRLAAQVDLQTARNNLEATKFQTRLQAVQTADDLGRISHLKYIAYLDHEHDRLNAIKHRTYQQQQELDQVDELLKSAQQSLEGQWNFGSINLPTPYQVRRRVEELYGHIVNPTGGHGSSLPGQNNIPIRDPGTRGNQTNTRVEIHINGADTAKVREIIREYSRGQVSYSSHTSRHR